MYVLCRDRSTDYKVTSSSQINALSSSSLLSKDVTDSEHDASVSIVQDASLQVGTSSQDRLPSKRKRDSYVEDDELERLNEEDREFGDDIEVPVKTKSQSHKGQKKKKKPGPKKVAKKARFLSCEIPWLAKNMLSFVIKNYTNIEANAKIPHDTKRADVVRFFEDEEEKNGIEPPEFDKIAFLRKLGELPKNLAKEDLPVLDLAAQADIEDSSQTYWQSWPRQALELVQQLRIDEWSHTARRVFFPKRDCMSYAATMKTLYKRDSSRVKYDDSRGDFSDHDSDWLDDNDCAPTGPKPLSMPWEVVEKAENWIAEQERAGEPVTNTGLRSELRGLPTTNTQLDGLLRTIANKQRCIAEAQSTRDSKEGSRLGPTHPWRIASGLWARYRAGEAEDIELSQFASGTSVSDRCCIYSGQSFLMAAYDITTLADIMAGKLKDLIRTGFDGIVLPPFYAKFYSLAHTTVECVNRYHYLTSREVPWLFGTTIYAGHTWCVDCCLFDDERRQAQGLEPRPQCIGTTHLKTPLERDVQERSQAEKELVASRVEIYRQIGPYNLFMRYKQQKKSDLATELSTLTLVVAYIKYLVLHENVACMDCLVHPYRETESMIKSTRDLIMHIDHLHVADCQVRTFVLEENITTIRGSVCSMCNCCLRTFYDKYTAAPSADMAFSQLTHYMQNGAGVFSEDQQEAFQELAGEMFGTSGPSTSADHSNLITRWQRAHPKPATAICFFTGKSTDLVLDHDHESLRLRGYIIRSLNLVIDRVAAVDIDTHRRCWSNLQAHRESLRGGPRTPFQRFAIDLIRKNTWLLTHGEALAGKRAEATRAILEAEGIYIPPPGALDDKDIRLRAVEWPEQTFGNSSSLTRQLLER